MIIEFGFLLGLNKLSLLNGWLDAKGQMPGQFSTQHDFRKQDWLSVFLASNYRRRLLKMMCL